MGVSVGLDFRIERTFFRPFRTVDPVCLTRLCGAEPAFCARPWHWPGTYDST